MSLDKIEWLQVENTTQCNAWCPACSRNQNGYGLSTDLVIEDLSLHRFAQVLDALPGLEIIQFCGNHGDTMAAQQAYEHIKLAKKHAKKIQIHTHGALRNTQWWKDLAILLSDIEHNVWFGIDGLKGVHEIHRQATDFDKVIENAQAFISHGGQATWQFIPFEHNEHQIKDCLKMSQKMGFKKFKLANIVRYNFKARHWKTGEPIVFKPWSRNQTTDPYQVITTRNILKHEHCRHLVKKSLYLNANGNISHCCYLNLQRQYQSLDALDDIAAEIQNKPDSKCFIICGDGAKIKEL
jgi:hypothetical protein